MAESIFDFFTREAGQKRRRALDDAVGGLLVPTSPDYKQYEMSPKASKQFMDDRAVEIADTFVEIEKRFGRGAALRYGHELLSGGRISGSMIDSARKANAPGIY